MKRPFSPLLALLLLTKSILASPIPPHPRLLVTDADWKILPAKMERNPIIKNIVQSTITHADSLLEKPPLERIVTGRRLLSVSRDAIQYILHLSAAYKITNDQKYLTRATTELLNICSFPDWNPEHHLDTAEMQTALAIGYDWLYHHLSPAERKTIETALLEKGLNSTLEHEYVLTRTNNWNQVCNGGITLSAIALMEIHPETSQKVLDLVRKSIPIAIQESYTPDGAYAEGGGYWNYGTEYSIITHEAFRTANLPDPGITSHKGFLESANYLVQVHGTSDKLFNYGDNHENPISSSPATAWIARESKNSRLLHIISPSFLKMNLTSPHRFHILTAFWLPENDLPPTNKLPTHFVGTGKSPIAIHRTGFDPNDIFLGIKAGMAKVNHGHMDAGSFVIDWQGQRWASDLGPQSYHSLEKTGMDLFSMKQDSQRWTSYRLNNHSHNTLTYNNQLHNVSGEAKIISSTPHPEHKTILDLTESLNLPKGATATRNFQLNTTSPPSITITDQLQNLNPGDTITWNMLTTATTKKSNNYNFLLTQKNKSISLSLNSPQATSATNKPLTPPNPHDDIPKDLTSISLQTKADPSGSIQITATFQTLSQ